MHALPWPLYQLTERDIGQPWGRIVFPRNTNTAALAALSASFQNQLTRVLAVTNLWGGLTPGAAQTITLASFQVVNPDATFARNLQTDRFALAAATAGFMQWEGELLVPPGWFVRLDAVFNAGAAANSVQLDAVAVEIPQGTIQLP